MEEAVGPYRLLRHIGVGGSADVFLARHEDAEPTSAPVVVKRLLPHLRRHDAATDMFEAEARLALRLRHPNIVETYDFGQSGRDYYIAMERVHGPTLAELIAQEQRLAPGVATRVLLDVCDALDAVHALGVVHGDVHPRNVMIDPGGMAKLTDFGVAMPHGEQTGPVRGTYAYMSPEQAQGHAVDQRSDVFAVGVMLWELMAGARLFGGSAPPVTLARVVEAEAPTLEDPRVNAVAQRCLAKAPGDRYGSATELATALGDAARVLRWDVRRETLASRAHASLSALEEER